MAIDEETAELPKPILRCDWRAPLAVAAAIAAGGLASPATAETRATAAGDVEIERMASRLRVPWAIDFLPGCEFLITERRGRLLHFGADGEPQRVSGVPDIADGGQGGLLDIVAAADFEESRTVYFSYSKRQAGGGAGTALGSARLSADGGMLEDVRTVFEMKPGSSGSRHFGSSIVESADGDLFVTIGDRDDRPSAQDLSSHSGAIVRIAPDGSVPDGNPFAGTPGALPEIWSYGHRNPQGAALDADGVLWAVEHGARGGDEINRIGKGLNYGWPVIAYGRHYSGGRIGEGFAKEGMEQPEFYWDPSIAPSALMIYSGKLWPEWSGHFFVGSLKFDYIARLDPEGGLEEVEMLEFPETKRVRDVREAPDGSIWFLSEDRRAAYRMAPANAGIAGECETRSR